MIEKLFTRIANTVSHLAGLPPTFIACCAIVIVWAVSGPFFGFSDTWQLVINTGTTVVTFLMVFLIQRTQNKDSLAIQLKLNEIVAAVEGASNRLISVEDLSEDELRILHAHYTRLAQMSKSERRLTESHSIEEAEARHVHKRERRAKHG
jgi:low affinity Fe/Cu permease